MNNQHIELYSIKGRDVLKVLKSGKKFKAIRNYHNESIDSCKTSLDDVNDTISKYLSKHVFDHVQTPIYCYVVTRAEGVESHLRDKDFRAFNLESKDKVILYLKVPMEECLLYDYNNYEYFNDINYIKQNRISSYE